MSDRGSESGATLSAHGPGSLTFGAFCFDATNGILSRDGSEIPLAPRPLAVLRCLLQRRRDVVSKQELMDEVWSDAVVGEATLLEVVGVLRKALGDDPRQPTYIQTLHRRGYRFIAEVSAATVATPGPADPAPTDGEAPPQPAGIAAPESRTTFMAWGLIAALTVVAAVVAFSSWPVGDSPVTGTEPTPVGMAPVDDPVWVLIANFDNATNQPSFNGTLEHALAQALTRSGFATSVPQRRIDDTLRLMRRPPNSPIDPATGMEISLRDGEIRALLTGRLQQLESSHVLTVEIIDPVEGVTVASVSHEVAASDDVAVVAAAAADRVVTALRGALPKLPGIPESSRMPRVTTASLRALQLYVQAGGGGGAPPPQGDRFDVAAIGRGSENWFPEMYEAAVSEDPDFAYAHIMLAWAVKNTDGAYNEYLPHAERAVALADGVTEAEEYWIRGSYERFRGNFDEAITHYEALIRVDPDHRWAVGNIKNYLQRYTPRFEQAVPYVVAWAEVRAGGWLANTTAAGALAIWGNDPERAATYVERAFALRPAEGDWQFSNYHVWLLFYPLHQRWLEGDVTGVLEELDLHAEALTSAVAANEWPRGRVNEMARSLGSFYLTLGRLAAADATFEIDRNNRQRSQHSTLVALARHGEGNLGDGLVTGTNSHLIPDLAVDVTLYLREGDLQQARALLDRLDSAYAETTVDFRQRLEPYVTIAHEALNLAEGRLDEMETNEYGFIAAVAALRPTGGIVYFRGAEALAAFWEAAGDIDQARVVLEDAWRQRARSHTFWRGDKGNYLYFAQSEWMRVAWKLAVMYRKLDRLAEARAIEDELRDLLVYADDDMWLVRQLQGLEGPGATQSR